MKASSFEFRFRMLIGILLYVMGFRAPWQRYTSVSALPTAWIETASLLARTHWIGLNQSTQLITSLAILFALGGAALRVWGTAFLGGAIVTSGSLHAEKVLSAGPYRFVRNPLYLGSWIFSAGVAILMPPQGAVFFLVAQAVFYFRLILREEDFLTVRLGTPYIEYHRRVPRLLPTLFPQVPASANRPDWGRSVLAEVYPAGMSLCLAALAWRYNVQLLIQCVMICFGLSLVIRALASKESRSSTEPA
ncbi:methyltransferase family protein [Paracidobacterium acidisoli]|uniref:Isoprenylcysteine carboxylmethyltransferase family protein n=1 Tax=Paracidobacterium acidisoli TaxID=2303751 RepID=A0A372IMR0_9BACT|nr:isoprenylcysteine carboxylmethyltransferase family protein [Paracidobacterium acidisoli]MBT9331892.1 isoprenylcysteine carboxylmethyltransferase family protein [Paracidobacterium acidisoli]